MLQILKSYVASDGTPFTELKDAQAHELAAIMRAASCETKPGEPMSLLGAALVEKASEVIDILTTTPTSLLKARRSRRGTKARKPKPNDPVGKQAFTVAKFGR